MQRTLKGILLSLGSVMPLWLPTIWALPWSFTVSKAEASMGLTLGTLLGSLVAIGLSLWLVFISSVTYAKGKEEANWWLKQLKKAGLFWLPVLAIFFLGGGFLLQFAVEILKASVADVKEMGQILILAPVIVYLFEAGRISNRWRYLPKDEEGKKSIGLQTLAVLQSPVVLGLWLLELWVIFTGLHLLFPALPNVWGYTIWMLLVLVGSVFAIFGLLQIVEARLYKAQLLPWRSHYEEWLNRFKYRDKSI